MNYTKDRHTTACRMHALGDRPCGPDHIFTLYDCVRPTMIRSFDNLATYPSSGPTPGLPRTNLPLGGVNRGFRTLSTDGSTLSNMMGPVMSALTSLTTDFPNLPSMGHVNVPNTYVPDAAINGSIFASQFKHAEVLPVNGTAVIAMCDVKSQRMKKTTFGQSQNISHSVNYPIKMIGTMNELPHPCTTPEGLNYYLLQNQLDMFSQPDREMLTPQEVADFFSVDSICIASIEQGRNAMLATTYQGRANYVNNTGVQNIGRGSKIYFVFKRCEKKDIPTTFSLAPYMSDAEKGTVTKRISEQLRTVSGEFRPVLMYPVVIASGGRIAPEYLMDKTKMADGAAIYFGKVFHIESYEHQTVNSMFGDSTDPETMIPFSDAGNLNDRGLMEVIVDVRRL